MRYRDFSVVLTRSRAVSGALELAVQVTDAADLPSILDPVRASCDLASVRLLAALDPTAPGSMRALLQAGRALGQALLPGVVGRRFRECLSVARSRGEGLRLRVLGGDPVHCLPWEYAVLAPERGEPSEVDFLALMPDVSIVRDQSIPRVSWSSATLPLRIAATAVSPLGLQALGVVQERSSLERELRPAGRSVSLCWTPRGARPSASEKAQLFHFAGHGDFSVRAANDATPTCPPPPAPGDEPEPPEGVLFFAGPDGEPDPVTAGQLGVILREMGVRVAVLNACRTASRDQSSSWSSVAAALLKAGVRSVVAMQHAILDTSATAFSAAFYRTLSRGGTLDEAARIGRMAVFDLGDPVGWGTPVLYLCAPDGVVFPEAQRRRGRA